MTKVVVPDASVRKAYKVPYVGSVKEKKKGLVCGIRLLKQHRIHISSSFFLDLIHKHPEILHGRPS